MDNRPHVLLITTDHWSAGMLGCAGHPAVQTPTLDQMARSGRRFTNAYSECPVCIPARRTLMTGLAPRSHGDRTFQVELTMPSVPTLADVFRENGYQAYAVGKTHVFPPRDRIGFDDVLLAEEGRPYGGRLDDYEIFLGEQGFAGRQFDHGMSNNEYHSRPWHLPEDCHVTNWTAREMCRMIRRRDPTRPGFWYLAFTHPHPPLAPPQVYWNMYRDTPVPRPACGTWAAATAAIPYRLKIVRGQWHCQSEIEIATAYRAFYALMTHIDHQIRRVIGTLREEGLLENTIICFTSDHGDMLGQHGLWAKRLYYENSANVPMLLVGTAGNQTVGQGVVDDRLVGWQDIMPTLLELAGLPAPQTVDGRNMVTGNQRSHLYGECNEGDTATRMIHCGRYKLIYYPAGNHRQLFDLQEDPQELVNLADDDRHSDTLEELTGLLVSELYGDDLNWLSDGRLQGLPEPTYIPADNRGLLLQRGVHWPPPPPPPLSTDHPPSRSF